MYENVEYVFSNWNNDFNDNLGIWQVPTNKVPNDGRYCHTLYEEGDMNRKGATFEGVYANWLLGYSGAET